MKLPIHLRCASSALHRLWASGVALALLASFAAAAAPATQPADEYPSHTLSNKDLTLTVYLPDAQKGFYRSSRFDWSGMISRVEYQGHTFFAPFKATHNPLGTDDVIGTAEEFGMDTALGYADAQVGQTFLKIGVGELLKKEEPKYWFPTRYQIVKPGPWKIESGKDWIEFVQSIGNDRGYAYVYTKRIVLRSDGFVIVRRLKNIGTRRIETDHYCHNFIVIDDEPVGPAYRLTFPFELKVDSDKPPKLHGVAELRGREISFTGPIPRGAAIWASMEGGKTAADNAVIIHNRKSGAILKIKGDLPTTKFVFYAQKSAACPEPFVQINLDPSEEMAWTYQYALVIGPAAE